jgi:hypothetical protein
VNSCGTKCSGFATCVVLLALSLPGAMPRAQDAFQVDVSGNFWVTLPLGGYRLDPGRDGAVVDRGIASVTRSPVEADTELDWYRTGSRYVVHHDWADPGHTRLEAQIGAGTVWPLTDDSSPTVEVLDPSPIPHQVQIASTEGAMAYCFLNRHGLRICGLLGIDYEQFSYNHNQEAPGEISETLDYMGIAGLEVTF